MQEKHPSLIIALIPIILLITLLSINVSLFGDNTISGSNQLTLLISAACAALLGLFYNVKYKDNNSYLFNNTRLIVYNNYLDLENKHLFKRKFIPALLK